LTQPVDDIAARFLADMAHIGVLPPRPNISPTEPLLAIRAAAGGGREACWLRWGLAPPWLDARGPRPINARAETAAARPMFREALRARRALLPADGFYEWRAAGRRKQPVRFGLAGGGLFAFGAIWELRRTPQGTEETACILTTGANGLVSPVHDRMPVILSPEDEGRWLDPTLPPNAVAALLMPFAAERMTAVDVDPRALRPAAPPGPLLGGSA
jgi:putative SOS response-associated peptidase YedK